MLTYAFHSRDSFLYRAAPFKPSHCVKAVMVAAYPVMEKAQRQQEDD